MIFSQPKQLSLGSILQQIQNISNRIESLGIEISNNQEISSQLLEVDLAVQQICTNLLNHSKIIRDIQARLNRRSHRINLKTVDQLLGYLAQWFRQYQQQEASYNPKQKAIKVLELEGKLNCLEEFMLPAITYQDDIAAFPLYSQPIYSKVYEKIKVIQSPNPQQTKEHYELFTKLMVVTNAAVLTELRQANSLLAVMTFGISYPRFWLDYKEAQLRNYAFLREPQLDKLLSIWNLPERGAISGLKYAQYPFIHTNKIIYIPLDQKDYETADILTPTERSVPVRILSNKPVVFWEEEKQGCSFGCWRSQTSIFQEVIIHAHGGGFVALSSSTMQNITRVWSKELDVLVLSIDYKKPPFTFPDPVYDVFAVYKFISSLEVYKHTNIRPTRIVMAGDSAGANLVLSATALAMKINLPTPVGFFLAYPASDLRSKYTPSRISSFSDAILHPSLLLLCLKQYLGDKHKEMENHPMASPLLISEAFVRGASQDQRWPLKWPRTRIMVGELDPLLDDSLRLCERMVHSGVDVSCSIYRQLGHGFLSVQAVVKQGQICIHDSIQILKQLLRYND